MKTGIELIAEERLRQKDVEGWTAEHDSQHVNGELAKAAACYALPIQSIPPYGQPPIYWAWDEKWWKPCERFFPQSKDERIRELQKAGALIAAEIGRLLAIENKEK